MLVSIISPSSKLEIMHRFFFIPYSLRNIVSKFEIFFQPIRQDFLGSRPVANRSTGSSGLVVNDSIFGI